MQNVQLTCDVVWKNETKKDCPPAAFLLIEDCNQFSNINQHFPQFPYAL